jgi:hypothetical protein
MAVILTHWAAPLRRSFVAFCAAPRWGDRPITIKCGPEHLVRVTDAWGSIAVG